MRPPAPASQPDPARSAPPRRRAPATVRVPAAAAGFLAGLALLMPACTGSEWPDRDPIEVRGAPVDTLEFLPPGSRYVLVDSLTEVRVGGFRLGYRCTEILAFGLERRTSPSAGYAARLDYRLPADPDCPLDSGARDSVLAARFAAADAPAARLLDSLGAVLDTALAVRGTLSHDSLELRAPSLSVFKSRFFFRDTVGSAGRMLSADSLSSCEFLNHAEYVRKSDSLKVIRYSWVTLDAAAAPDSCRGPLHGDFLAPLAR